MHACGPWFFWDLGICGWMDMFVDERPKGSQCVWGGVGWGGVVALG